MLQYLRNTRPRRLTSCKSVVCKLGLVALVVLGLMACTQAAYATSFIITGSVAPPGSGTISPSGQVSVDAGGSQTFTASNPQTGYYFAYFQVDGVNQAPGVASYTFTNVRGAHSIVAVFSNTYTITASVTGGNGTITPAGTTPVNYNQPLAIVITPNPGYYVADVKVDGASVGPVTLYTFYNVSANHTIEASFTDVAHTFTLQFDQSAYQGAAVWLQVQDATQTFKATYSGTSITFQNSGDIMSVPVMLSVIGTGGLTISYAKSAILYLFYDDPTDNDRTAAPSAVTSLQRFMPVELTMTGAAGDSGDLTAINYFTAPLSISSYESDPSQSPSPPALQQTGYGSNTAAQIGALLSAASGGNPNAVVKNAQGRIIRYIGPSNFTGTNPWPSFIPYTLSIYAANQPTTIQNTNGFTFYKMDGTTPDGPSYTFGAGMTATANSDGSITIKGSITASANGLIKGGNPPLPAGGAWSDAEFDFSVSDPNAFNNAIYGQVQTSAVTFKNSTDTTSAWYQFQQFTQQTLKNPSLPHNPVSNPSLYDNVKQDNGKAGLNAYNTTLNMFIGEVTTGLLGGFFNSSYPATYPPASIGMPLMTLPSYQWWQQTPIVGFADIQTQNPYYNLYANEIFKTSNNTVYGVPYSDRFGTGPVVNSVNYTNNGTSYPVNYWVIGIGAPLPATNKALPGMLLLLMDN